MHFKRLKVVGMAILLLSLLLAACSDGADTGTREVNAEAVFAAGDEDKLTMRFINLEATESAAQSGQAIFIKTPKGKTIMVDAGKPEFGTMIDDYLSELNVEKLDLVLSSHPHVDHIGGFTTLFKTKEIGKVIGINLPLETDTYKHDQELIEEEDIDVEYADEGDVIELEDDLVLEILSPSQDTVAQYLLLDNLSAGIVNDLSMVVKITYKDKSFLLTGDIYKGIEDQLVKTYGDELNADVVVAPHHGIGTSSSTKFIEAVNPDITVIASNILMDQGVYDNFLESSSEVYVNDLDGNILLKSDGKTIDIYTEKERTEKEEDFPNES